MQREIFISQFRPSVCPSVGSGHAGVVSKRLNIVKSLLPPDSQVFLVLSHPVDTTLTLPELRGFSDALWPRPAH